MEFLSDGVPSDDVATEDTAAPAVAHLNVEDLAEAVRERRASAGLSMRRAANAADISFMTLSRVEAGGQPDLSTFLRLCAWLRVPPETYLVTGAPRDRTTPEVVASHLQSDPRLEPGAATRIAEIVRDLYEVLAREPAARPTVACHLRAASSLRPGVPDRLGLLLSDLQSRLHELEADGQL